MRTLAVAGIFTIVTFGLAAAPVHAADDRVPQEPGFHGNVLLGAGYFELESNLVAGNDLIDASTSTIGSVTQPAPSNDTTYAIVSGELSYVFGNRWEAFFGVNIEDYVTLDFATRLGLRKQWDGVGVLGASLVTTAALPTEVWEDPYLVGTPRLATELDSSGLRLDWWRIFGTGFFAQLQSRDIEVESEASGTDPALGLGADEILLLRRDGTDSRATLGYRWENGRHTWQPQLTFASADRDGDAVAGEATTLQLSYGYRGDLWTFVAAASVAQREYDAANPVYGVKTDADGYAVSLSAFRKLDLGTGDWRAFASIIQAENDSDVDFHDSSAFAASVGVAYFFGR
ncbi:DUF2860 family protein [Thioalkalivibrio sp. XN8]|uniref:DUF2860 family protein n=1 Tax=Thioalkalivibrio sp. XN8 TaxID=2712863 RepID=UPI0013EDA920|nr:DUF2860 family protein [Thioalkalivibrio sp. XN8]NGP53558.1 DUF2860 family protein [Thioalkalivibrio sp. XN8]